MDEGVKKDIEAEAHAIHSMPITNAKKELNKIQTMLMDPDTDVNAKAVLQTKRGPLVQRMTALRLEFIKVKEAKINELAEKYQGIDKSEIASYLEGCLADCESEKCKEFSDIIKQDNPPSEEANPSPEEANPSPEEANPSPEEANPSPEELILTIPAIYHEPTILEMKMGLSDNSAEI